MNSTSTSTKIKNPLITNLHEGKENNILTFTLSNVNVSLANAIRRTILSDIECIVFKTTPHEENKADISINTTSLNNEILKQRLSCIPIHGLHTMGIPLSDLLLEVDVENKTEDIMYVTTEDFKVRHVNTDKYLDNPDEIFPPNEYTGGYIDFVRLRPKISDEIPGEKLRFTCEFSVGTAKENGMYNVVSTCSYGCTPDAVSMDKELEKLRQKWKDENANVEFESKNWRLLDGMRHIKKDSFDFVIETIGVYTNKEIVKMACKSLNKKIKHQKTLLNNNEIYITQSKTTMAHSFDITLVNEDYTIGKVIEYMFYAKFFEGTKILSYCGFVKMHPHDKNSLIRIAFKESVDMSMIHQCFRECLDDSIQVFEEIEKMIK
jgi:DNA-directed RNA polymerase alpha subunit